MSVVEKLDELGKPAWIGLMVVSFVLFWPAGLAVLAYLIWSGRMGCWKSGRDRWQDGMSRMRESAGLGRRASSGNAAFDEYREQTLRRLEEEQAEFRGFLEQLRRAKDKAEFDQFMASRRPSPAPAPEGQA